MHHEGKRPGATLRIGRAVRTALRGPLLRGFTKRRRPRKCQDVEVELAGLAVLAVAALIILREGNDGKDKQETEGDRGGPHGPLNTKTHHRYPLITAAKNKT